MANTPLKTTVEIAGVLSPSLQKSIQEAVDRLDAMSQETLDSAGAAAKLSAEIKAQEDVLRNLQRGYEDFVVSGKESSDAARQVADQIQSLSGDLTENRETLDAAYKAAQKLADGQQDAKDAYCQLEAQISKQDSELSSLRRQYANVALEQGESSDEAQQLAGKISSLSGELGQNQQKLRDAKQAAEQLGDSFEDAAEQTEGFSDGYTVFKDIFANLATDAIIKGAGAIKDLAIEGDSAMGMLSARTGATGKDLEGLEDVMYDVYGANYGESLDDVQEKLSTVVQMTDDLDKASLTGITKNAMSLEGIFGYDVTESIRTANSMMDQFGIDSEQAFNLIVQGAWNGLDQNGDMLDTINEYSVQFKNAGFSADDMMNMLVNGVKAGTWSVDILGDAVKEYNINWKDGTAADALEKLGFNADEMSDKLEGGAKSSGKAMQQVIAALMGVEDEQDRYTLGQELMGTMWEDLGEDAVAALMNTQGPIDSTIDAMSQVDSSAYDTLESSMSQLGRTVQMEVAQPVADVLTPALKDAVDFVNGGVKPAIGWITDNLPAIGIAVGTVGALIAAAKWGGIVAQIGKMKGVIGGIVKAFTGIPGPVLAVIGIIAALAAGFMYLWDTNEAFRDTVMTIWDQLQGSFAGVGESIMQMITQLLPVIQTIATVLMTVFTQVISAILPFLMQLISAVLPVILSLISQLAPVIGMIATMLQPILNLIISLIQPILNLIMTALTPLLNIFMLVINTALRPITTIFQSLITILQGLITFITGVFAGSWSTAWSGIVQTFGGLWEGLVAIVKAPINAVIGLVNKAISGLNSISVTIPEWVPGVGGQTFGVNIPSVPMLATGGFTDGVSIAGEDGMEAVISFKRAYRSQNLAIWERAGQLLGAMPSQESSSGNGGFLSTAGKLLTLDDFSLGSLAESNERIEIYYDFSGFQWAPQIQTGGTEDPDDFMTKLKAHEAEFFDWLEEFISIREEAQYA